MQGGDKTTDEPLEEAKKREKREKGRHSEKGRT